MILLSISCTNSRGHTQSCSFYRGHDCVAYTYELPFMTCRMTLSKTCIIYGRIRHRYRSVDVFGRIVRRQQPSGVPGRHGPDGRFLGWPSKHDRNR